MHPQSDPVKFLIVDDNSEMRQTLARYIKREGDEIFECDDGGEALAMYQRHRPDWVLMDINMKRVGGIEATEHILAADPAAKVNVVTDYGDKFFRRAASGAGARGFITKEDLSELPSIVRNKP